MTLVFSRLNTNKYLLIKSNKFGTIISGVFVTNFDKMNLIIHNIERDIILIEEWLENNRLLINVKKKHKPCISQLQLNTKTLP